LSKLRVERIHENAKLPTKSYDFAAGYDLYVVSSDNQGWWQPTSKYAKIHTFMPGTRVVFHTGIKIELPSETIYIQGIPHKYHAFIWDRSGLSAKNGIHRFAGVIDNDYRGEWMICLQNTSTEAFRINEGDKIAQFVINLVPSIEITEIEKVNETNRGSKGFGSSG